MNYFQKKKMFLMCIMDNVKGFFRTITGLPPITLTDCVDSRSVKNYQIYGNSIQARLPQKYQEVEYIESTGTQYIDTGYKPNQNTTVRVDFEATYLIENSTLFGITGTNGLSDVGRYGIALVTQMSTSFYRTFYGSYVALDYDHVFYTGARHIIHSEINDSAQTVKFYLDGSQMTSHNYADGLQSIYNFEIFASYHETEGVGYNPSAMKLYSFKIYESGELVRDFIPCYRKNDSVIGLYDLVEAKFYTNQGTGTFLKGADYVDISPDNPVEVKSVGVRTRNLFSEDNISGGHGVVEYNGVRCLKYVDSGYTNDNFKITGIFEEDTKYYITMTMYISDNHSSFTNDALLRIYFTDGDYFNVNIGYSEFGKPIKFHTIYTNKTISSIESIYNGANTLYLDLTNLQIEKDAFTDYEPYGYKIPVTAYANEFDVNNFTWLQKPVDRVDYHAIKLQLKPNTKYAVTCSYNTYRDYVVLTNGEYFRSNGVGIWLAHRDTTPPNNNLVPGVITTFTTKDSGLVYISSPNYWSYNNTQSMMSKVFNNSLIIREADTEPITTNIYLKEPLRANEGYIDFENKKVVRYIYEGNLTNVFKTHPDRANAVTVYITTTDVIRFGIITNVLEFPEGLKNSTMMCNILPNVKNDWLKNTQSIFFHNNSNYSFYISFTKKLLGVESTDTVEQKITKVIEYIKNNDMKVYYIQNSPTEEKITLPTLPTFKGKSVTYTIDTEVQPTEISVTYYSNTKGE